MWLDHIKTFSRIKNRHQPCEAGSTEIDFVGGHLDIIDRKFGVLLTVLGLIGFVISLTFGNFKDKLTPLAQAPVGGTLATVGALLVMFLISAWWGWVLYKVLRVLLVGLALAAILFLIRNFLPNWLAAGLVIFLSGLWFTTTLVCLRGAGRARWGGMQAVKDEAPEIPSKLEGELKTERDYQLMTLVRSLVGRTAAYRAGVLLVYTLLYFLVLTGYVTTLVVTQKTLPDIAFPVHFALGDSCETSPNLRDFVPRARQAVSPCFRADACAALRFATVFPLTLQGWAIPLSLRFLPPPLAAAGRGAVIQLHRIYQGERKDMRTEKIDIYGEITNQIIEAIEAGADKYQMPWHVNGADSVLPLNASTHRPYRGVNVMMLWAVAAKHEYATSLWATYQQWRELGAQVRKGEKSTSVVFWKFFDEEEREVTEGNERSNYKGVMARAYHVFNAAQVDGYNVPVLPRLPETERIERAEQFFSGLHADIREGGSRAFYTPAEDYIQMPPFAVFKKADFRYSVLAHEITHWSGATTRLNRNLAPRFQKEAYAAEELIAELGSAFVCAELELEIEPRRDHAPYIQSWLNVLRNDRRAIFTAPPRRSKPSIGSSSEMAKFRRPPRKTAVSSYQRELYARRSHV